MAFYVYNQNNTGGSFESEYGLAWKVIIEADTLEEAEEKGFELGIYYDGVADGIDCDCCGDRWYEPERLEFPYEWDQDTLFGDVEAYAYHVTKEYGGWTTPDVVIHYTDDIVEITKE